jgi:hypothetical protein
MAFCWLVGTTTQNTASIRRSTPILCTVDDLAKSVNGAKRDN